MRKSCLTFDLSTGRVSCTEIPQETIGLYIGGRGLGAYHYWMRRAKQPDYEAILCVPGAANGLGLPAAGRYVLLGLSPLTKTLMSSSSGGGLGAYLMVRDIAVLEIVGKAVNPTILHFSEEFSRANPVLDSTLASDEWLCSTTQQKREEAEQEDVNLLTTGPAAWKGVRYASACDGHRVFGRGGMGLAMADLNLAGIVYPRSSVVVEAAHKHLTMDMRSYLLTQSRNSFLSTFWSLKAMQEDAAAKGILDTPSYSAGLGPSEASLLRGARSVPWLNFSPEPVPLDVSTRLATNDAEFAPELNCKYCPKPCASKVRGGGKAARGPEHQSGVGFGPLLGISDYDVICRANALCDDLGVDTMEMASTLATASELGLIELNENAIITGINDLMEQTSELGRDLAQGCSRLAVKHGRADAAQQVKQMGVSFYNMVETRAIALLAAVSSRGPDHCRGGMMLDIEMAGVVEGLLHFEIQGYLVDCLGLCRFAMFNNEAALRVGRAIGIDLSQSLTEDLANRICTVERMFNIEIGLSSRDDIIPETWFSTDRAGCLVKMEFEEWKQNYYVARGWTPAGVPTADTIARLRILDENDSDATGAKSWCRSHTVS